MRDSGEQVRSGAPVPAESCRSIDWYAPGQSRVFEVDGVRVVVRFVGRKGRRGRIAVEVGEVFEASEPRAAGVPSR